MGQNATPGFGPWSAAFCIKNDTLAKGYFPLTPLYSSEIRSDLEGSANKKCKSSNNNKNTVISPLNSWDELVVGMMGEIAHKT